MTGAPNDHDASASQDDAVTVDAATRKVSVEVQDLVARSNRLGADTRNTNYGGGNTSAKGTAVDPVSGDDIDLVWVKGSGSDLATLTASDLAVLDRRRILEMQRVYRGPDHEDEMVPLFDHCHFGVPGPAPSIDTAMHGLVDAPHVDHLHPDGVIAIAASVDGPELTERIYGGRVLWVDWRRPGFELGLQIARLQHEHPDVVGVVLGGHGTTAWGATSAECEANSVWMIRTAEEFLERFGRAEPFGPCIESRRALEPEHRAAVARRIHPLIRACASVDESVVGHWNDSSTILDFLSRQRAEALASLGTSCPDHYLRIKVAPMFVEIDPTSVRSQIAGVLDAAHRRYRNEYTAYYQRHADADSAPMRGADPRIVLVPGVGMFSFARDERTARICGEYFLNAVNSMRGAEAVSTYRPIPEAEKFRIEYWSLEEAKLRRKAVPALSGQVVVVAVTVPAAGEALANELAVEGAAVVIVEHGRPITARAVSDAVDRCAEEFGGVDAVIAMGVDLDDAGLWNTLANATPGDRDVCVVMIEEGGNGDAGSGGVAAGALTDGGVLPVEIIRVGASDIGSNLETVSRTVVSIVAGSLDPSSGLNIRRIDRALVGSPEMPTTIEGNQ